jgi:hypothetical protein
MSSFIKLLPKKEVKDVQRITKLKPESIYNLVKSKRLKAKKINGKWYFCNDSLNEFEHSFQISDYLTVKEVTAELQKHDVCDKFRVVSKSETKKKKNKYHLVYSYKRYLDEFPISPTQLEQQGLIVSDKDMVPKLYSKSSVANAITKLQQKSLSEATVKKADLIKKDIEHKKDKLLRPKIDKWEKELVKSTIKKVDFTTPKPTLTSDEIKAIEDSVHQRHLAQPLKNGDFLSIKPKPKNKQRGLKGIKRLGKKS